MARGFPGFPDGALTFWQGIEANNDKAWFSEHRKNYKEQVRDPMCEFVDALNSRLVKFAPEFETQPRRAISLPNRDLRFDSDAPPYKTFLSASFRPPAVKRGAGATLSVSVGLEGVTWFAGLSRPAGGVVMQLRQRVAADTATLRRALRRPLFREIYGELGWPQVHARAQRLRPGSPRGRTAAPFFDVRPEQAARRTRHVDRAAREHRARLPRGPAARSVDQ